MLHWTQKKSYDWLQSVTITVNMLDHTHTD